MNELGRGQMARSGIQTSSPECAPADQDHPEPGNQFDTAA